MDKQKVVVILLVIAIVMSVISVVVNVALNSNFRDTYFPTRTVNNNILTKNAGPDAGNLGVTILKPGSGP